MRQLDDGDDAYLRAVIAESLRPRPVVPLAGRRLTSELRADGLVLPAGTDVTPAIGSYPPGLLSRALCLPSRAFPGPVRRPPARGSRSAAVYADA